MEQAGRRPGETVTVAGRRYEVVRLLGHGKGGWSYLVTDGAGEYTLKEIHHEPCDYYTTNFIVRGGTLVYIDYECNDYMPEWDFPHWGAQYWGAPPAE